jgi:hypothetical protein
MLSPIEQTEYRRTRAKRPRVVLLVDKLVQRLSRPDLTEERVD